MIATAEINETSAARLVAALGAAWSEIRRQHPEVPPCVVTVLAQRAGRAANGHFWALRWRRPAAGSAEAHEVALMAEELHRGGEDVMETLIHEAAHALNFARKIDDCSASQYHNKHFARAAVEIGLDVEKVKNYGYARTKMAPGTADRYRVHIEAIQAELMVRRADPGRVKGGSRGGSRSKDGDDFTAEGTTSEPDRDDDSRWRRAVCGCTPEVIIRASRRTLQAGTVTCSACQRPFSESA